MDTNELVTDKLTLETHSLLAYLYGIGLDQAVSRCVVFEIVERQYVVRRDALEDVVVDGRVLCRNASKQVVEVVANDVADVDSIGIAEIAAQQQPEYLLPKREGKLAHLHFLSVQTGAHELLVTYHGGQLRVPLSYQAAVVDVGRAADDVLVVDYQRLGVDVDDLLHKFAHKHCPASHAVERDVLVGVLYS